LYLDVLIDSARYRIADLCAHRSHRFSFFVSTSFLISVIAYMQRADP